MQKTKNGLSILATLIIFTVVASLISGGLYVKELQSQKNSNNISVQAEQQAQALKAKIKEENKQFVPQDKFLAPSLSANKSPQFQPKTAQISLQEWRDLTNQIRALKTVQQDGSWVSQPPKGDLIIKYLGIFFNEKSHDTDVIRAMIDGLPKEVDRELFFYNIGILRSIIDTNGIKRLINLINITPKSSARHALYVGVIRDIRSLNAMPALREVVRTTSDNYLMSEAMFALMKSGREDDIRAVFDRISEETKEKSLLEWIYSSNTDLLGNSYHGETDEPNNEELGDQLIRKNLASLPSPSAESLFDGIFNPDALPFLLNVASGKDSKYTKATQEVAIYNLVRFRKDPKVVQLLNELSRSSDQEIAKGAVEVLTTKWGQ